MKIRFYKYQGAGNDFIMIDNRDNRVNHHHPELIVRLCDRRFGIGGDGLMLLQNKEGYDFEMVYYNADGQPSSMCGNGGRCIVAFAKFLGIIDTETEFLAVDGPHHAKIAEIGEDHSPLTIDHGSSTKITPWTMDHRPSTKTGDWVSLQMIDVKDVTKDADAYVLNTGSPHYVKLVDGLAQRDVYHEGHAIRNNAIYHENGINVNFVEPTDNGYFVRTFERGVEDETFACGTGVTAVALAMAQHNHQTGHITTPIKVLGGNLNIRFNYDGQVFSEIFLEGPAVRVFEGDVEI